jgi:uncharacterized protein involved in oxidation of intracellular sulfur
VITAKTLVILNDPPYGTERSWNGLRLAGSLAGRDGSEAGCSCLATRSAALWPARRCPTATARWTA